MIDLVYNNILNILKSLMLKQLPQERCTGVINLFSSLFCGGTDEDLENALVSI